MKNEAQTDRREQNADIDRQAREIEALRDHVRAADALRDQWFARAVELTDLCEARLAEMERQNREIAALRDQVRAADALRGQWFARAVELTDLCEARLAEMERQNREITALRQTLDDAQRERDRFREAYSAIRYAFFWKISTPVRAVLNAIIRAASPYPRLFKSMRIFKWTVRHGVKYAKARYEKEYGIRFGTDRITPEQRKLEENTVFPKAVRFSILVPLYNTPMDFLEEMIDSVRKQTYSNWELCLADGSTPEHAEVGEYCKKLAKHDKRIKYRKLAENGGISCNTNACIEMAEGDYLSLLDHDDILHPSALFDVMTAICEKNADFIYTDEATFSGTPSEAYTFHFKPDYAPDTLRANNYICHFTSFKRALLEKAGGGFRPECDGSQDFDITLRLTEQAHGIVHIPRVLYYWRAHKNSVAGDPAAKPYVFEAAKRAIRDHLDRVGLKGEVLDSAALSTYRIRYAVEGNPLISIIIPNCEHKDDLKRCIDSIKAKSTYKNYEIIVVENNSKSEEIFSYYKELKKDKKIRVVRRKGIFNFSAICNYGVRYAKGKHILLLNNDTEVIAPDWMQEMLMYSQRSDVGCVGAKLYYPDHTIQHAGVGIGLLGLAAHYHRHVDGNELGYMGRLSYAQNLSAVTGACMMIRRSVFDEVKGYNEDLEVAFNDIDFCMKVRRAGYLIVFTPFAELYHYESKSRGLDDTPDKRQRLMREIGLFRSLWTDELAKGDPYFNPNFSPDSELFEIRGR